MTTVSELLEQIAILKAQTTRDMLDEELVMNQATWDSLAYLTIDEGDRLWTPDVTFSGVPVVILELLPDGVIHRRPRGNPEPRFEEITDWKGP